MITNDLISKKFEDLKGSIIEQNLIERPFADIVKNFDVLKRMVFDSIEDIEKLLKSKEFNQFISDIVHIYNDPYELVKVIEDYINNYFREMLLSFGKEIQKETALSLTFSKRILKLVISDCIDELKSKVE